MSDEPPAAAGAAETEPSPEPPSAKPTREPPGEFPIGNVWEKYETDDHILGEGAFGRVMRATVKATGEPCAIKVLDKRKIKGEAGMLELKNERAVLLTANHESIVNMLDAMQDDEAVYFVLELAGGGELWKYIQNFGVEEMPKLAPRLVAEVILALDYLHKARILHRDLKPENLLLTKDIHVKLSDFGTAIFVDDESQATSFTGTPEYVSPEMLESSRCSRASDLWALGCVIYQLFTARTPFFGESQYLLFQNIRERKMEFPVYFPESAKDLVDKLLQVKPEDRIGATDYEALRSHKFFTEAEINWDTLYEKDNLTIENKDYTSEWKNFLLKGETVIFTTWVKKTRRLLSVKKRQLILTDYPRLFYVSSKKVIKGKVPWTGDTWAEVVNPTKFLVHTPTRDYDFDCMFEKDSGQSAELWARKINSLVKR